MIKQKHQKDIHFWSKFFWWLGFLQSSLSQVIVERSRFKPVTFMHTEVLEATSSWSLAIRDWVLSDVEDKNFHEHLPYMYIYIYVYMLFCCFYKGNLKIQDFFVPPVLRFGETSARKTASIRRLDQMT